MKTEKMKENRAGHYIPEDFAVEFVDEMDKLHLSDEFIKGACCAFAYLTCSENDDMHGRTPAEFLKNTAEINAREEDALKIVEALEAAGFHVDDAYLVEVK